MRRRFPDLRTLPSSTVATPNSLPICRMSISRPRNRNADVRDATWSPGSRVSALISSSASPSLKVLILCVCAHVGEGEDGDRLLVGGLRRRRRSVPERPSTRLERKAHVACGLKPVGGIFLETPPHDPRERRAACRSAAPGRVAVRGGPALIVSAGRVAVEGRWPLTISKRTSRPRRCRTRDRRARRGSAQAPCSRRCRESTPALVAAHRVIRTPLLPSPARISRVRNRESSRCRRASGRRSPASDRDGRCRGRGRRRGRRPAAARYRWRVAAGQARVR